MGYKVITKCPICNSKLKIAKLKCNTCGTVIENDFEFSSFHNLDSEQLYFAEIFIKCRGNIKEVEKELSISYPTVRTKLDDLISSLGYAVQKPKTASGKDILDMLEKGEISPEEAVKILNE
jgi:hypothetical protein